MTYNDLYNYIVAFCDHLGSDKTYTPSTYQFINIRAFHNDDCSIRYIIRIYIRSSISGEWKLMCAKIWYIKNHRVYITTFTNKPHQANEKHKESAKWHYRSNYYDIAAEVDPIQVEEYCKYIIDYVNINCPLTTETIGG